MDSLDMSTSPFWTELACLKQEPWWRKPVTKKCPEVSDMYSCGLMLFKVIVVDAVEDEHGKIIDYRILYDDTVSAETQTGALMKVVRLPIANGWNIDDLLCSVTRIDLQDLS
jgi:hypothetical protein